MYNVTPSPCRRQVISALKDALKQKGHFKCPFCKSFRVSAIENRYFCSVCRKKFSATSCTWLKYCKLDISLIVRLMDCWLNEYPIVTTAKETGVSTNTVSRYYRLFRLNIVRNDNFEAQDSVQVDEAYFGRFRKRANSMYGIPTYKVKNKVGVFGIGCPKTGKLKTTVIGRKPGKFIKQFINDTVSKKIKIFSDKSPYYTHLGRYGYNHHAQTHIQGFGTAYFIESCWSWMKRKLFKQYHHFTSRYASEYIAELTWRFNNRKEAKNPIYYLMESLKTVPGSW